MKYSDSIEQKILFFNSILKPFGITDLLNDSRISVQLELNKETYLRFHFICSMPTQPKIEIILDLDSVQINLDTLDEAFEWNNNSLIHERDKIFNIIQNVVSSKIVIESFGAYKRILFFKEGRLISKFKHWYGLWYSPFKDKKTFAPLFEKHPEENLI